MANPQTKNGYTRIANEILENISKTNLNGTQLRIVMVIWRYTYGFRRKAHEISLAFMAEAIDTTKSHVDRELTALIDRKIINVVGVGTRRGRILSFNKNYEAWEDKPPEKVEQPDPPKKQPKKPTKTKKYDESNTYYKMAIYFHKMVSAVAKEAGVEHLIKKANLQKWADDFRKLVELDGVKDKKQILAVMDWVTKDDFWRTNVLSAKKFREKFGELAIKMNSSMRPKKPVQQQRPDPRDKDIEFQRWIENGGDPREFNK